MKKAKRLLSIVIIVQMLCSLFIISMTTASAYATGDDYPAKYKTPAIDSVVDEWNFYNRECTSFVAWCLNSRNGVGFTNWYGGVRWGNADNWGNAARSIGITVNNNPAVGSVAWTTSCHVAWVKEVNGNTIKIDEYNWGKDGKYHERTLNKSSFSGYIHIKDISSPHTHNFNTFVEYQSAHPHYAVYKCSCGATQVNKGVTKYSANCSTCVNNLSPSVSISNGDYHIISSLDHNYGLNVSSNSKESGANVQLWNNMDYDNTTSLVTVKHLGSGIYSLTFKNSGKALDTYNAGTNSGTNVQQYNPNSSNAQKWIIKSAGDGYYFNIISKCSGLYLDAKDGKASGGTNIQVYTPNGSKAQKWRFVRSGLSAGESVKPGDYYITSALSSNLSLDVESNNNQANVCVMNKSFTDMPKYKIEYIGSGYYRIKSSFVDRRIDVYNNNPNKGSNVQLWDSNDNNAQKWILQPAGNGYFNVIAMFSGLLLDVDNANTTDKTNVTAWTDNGGIHQKWRLTPVNSNKEGFYNGHKYEYFNLKSNFAQAYKHCEKLGGHLATVNSKEENIFLTGLTNGYNGRAWIGGTSFGGTKWQWITGEKYEFENWAPGEPNNPDANELGMDFYVSGDNTGMWNNESLGNANVEGFICEFEDEINPKDYTPEHISLYKGQEYEFYDLGVDWQTAKKICEAKGGHLAIINDAAENAAIAENIKLMNKNEAWIGYTDIEVEGVWKDINGNKIPYSNWMDKNPDNDMEIEDYGFLDKNGKCGDLKGFSFVNHSMGFVCEYDGLSTLLSAKNTMEYNEHKYEYYQIQTNWEKAKEFCEKKGGHLVTITSEEENDSIVKLTQDGSGRIWTGGQKNSLQNWEWITDEPFVIAPWSVGEPSNTNGVENRIDFYVSGENVGCWNDERVDNSNVEGFVCEYDTPNATEQTEPVTESTDLSTEMTEIDSTEVVETNTTEPGTSEVEPVTDATELESGIVVPPTEKTKPESDITAPTNGQETIVTETLYTIPIVTEPTDTTPFIIDPIVTTPSVTDPTQSAPIVTEPIEPVVTQLSNPAPSKPTVASKKANTITVKAKTVKIKAKKLKKKAQKVKAITVKNAQGKVTYKLVKSGINKKIRKLVKINSKGVITIKKWKKAKKGTYKIKVTVKAAGNANYNAKTITKTIKVKIK